MNSKNYVKKRSWPILSYICGCSLEALQKTSKISGRCIEIQTWDYRMQVTEPPPSFHRKFNPKVFVVV